ncbi:MAG TPA: fasciclin domain-containing protein [Chloroflexota bacterium]|nr:fasciclin domain-containing protein [Chloroflexota bacterium]HUM69154.1 fasciclin domain-containing protein [Chloroflexota bacterium]
MKTKKILLILLVAVLFMAVAISKGSSPVAAAPTNQTDGGEADVSQIDETEPEASQNLMDVVEGRDQLSDFKTLLEAVGLTDNLAKDGPFTVFAPTNAALATFNTLATTTNATVTDILLYHIVNGQYYSPDLVNFSTMPTLLGEHVAISVEDGEIMLNDVVRIITTDIEADNGIVHIVDAVLIPPVNSLITADQGSRSKTLDEVLADDGRFTTFLSLAKTAGLDAALADLGQTHTVFAPTDAAFENLPEELMADIQADPETFIAYLLVNDMLGINQIATAQYIPTVEGRPLFVSMNEKEQVQINGQPLAEYNMVAANGIIHVADTVPIP